ncbi:MAG: hypothetical protein LBC18_10805 [Opitutaceae bacterium]|jgi:hypothetical protein|nr:hypothetical protein [Opitutaceae bacterium]
MAFDLGSILGGGAGGAAAGGGGAGGASTPSTGNAGMNFDIAGSASAAVSQSLQSTISTKFGNNIRNLGSGTITARFDETNTADLKNASDAKATSATAKTGDGGMADATSVLQSEGGSFSGSAGLGATTAALGLPAWFLPAALALAALATLGAMGIGIFAIKNK